MRRITAGTIAAAVVVLGLSTGSIAAPIIQPQGREGGIHGANVQQADTTGTTIGIITGTGTATTTVGTTMIERAF